VNGVGSFEVTFRNFRHVGQGMFLHTLHSYRQHIGFQRGSDSRGETIQNIPEVALQIIPDEIGIG